MKLFKYIAATSLVVAALATSASATALNVYITGSSAFRSAVLGGLAPSSGNGIWDSFAAVSEASDASNTTSISNNTNNTTFAFEGGTIGGTAINVYCTFTGSVSGIYSVGGSESTPFLAVGITSTYNTTNSNAALAPSAYLDSSSSQPNSGANFQTATPDFCFSDCFQSSTLYTGKYTLDNGQGSVTFPSLTDYTGVGGITGVGIVTFKFMASAGFPQGTYTSGNTSSYSMTPKLFASIFGTGYAQLSQISGNSSDWNNEVIATGRNPDSGTRINALADTGYGTAKTVAQYSYSSVSGSQVTGLQQYPGTLSGFYVAGKIVAAGNNGAGSGADLRPYLGYTIAPAAAGAVSGHTPTNAYFVTYLGISDAKTTEAFTNGGGSGTEAGPAIELSYNGIPYSNNAIYNGVYSYWGYEHMYKRSSITTQASATYNALGAFLVNAAQVTSSAVTGAGFSLADPNMLVKRTGDGATITLKSTFPF